MLSDWKQTNPPTVLYRTIETSDRPNCHELFEAMALKSDNPDGHFFEGDVPSCPLSLPPVQTYSNTLAVERGEISVARPGRVANENETFVGNETPTTYLAYYGTNIPQNFVEFPFANEELVGCYVRETIHHYETQSDGDVGPADRMNWAANFCWRHRIHPTNGTVTKLSVYGYALAKAYMDAYHPLNAKARRWLDGMNLNGRRLERNYSLQTDPNDDPDHVATRFQYPNNEQFTGIGSGPASLQGAGDKELRRQTELKFLRQFNRREYLSRMGRLGDPDDDVSDQGEPLFY